MVHATNMVRVASFATLCALVWYGQQYWGWSLDPSQLQPLESWSWGWLAAYFGFWIVANSIMWPALAGGILFGFTGGTALGVVGAVGSAVIQLVAYRTLLREPAQAWFGARIAPVQEALEQRSFGVLIVWRLLWLPLSLVTVATALSRIPVWHHAVATVASVPAIIAFCWLADGIVAYGLWGLPLGRLLPAIAVLAGGALVWWLAQQRWPVLGLSGLRAAP